MRLNDAQLRVRASAVVAGWEERAADADAANDRAILAAINRAIELQTGDTDSPSDAKVMAALQAAKTAQEADLKENG